MQKIIYGLALLAAVACATAQNRQRTNRGGYAHTSTTYSRTTSTRGHTSTPQRTYSSRTTRTTTRSNPSYQRNGYTGRTYSGTRYATSHAGTRSYGTRSGYSRSTTTSTRYGRNSSGTTYGRTYSGSGSHNYRAGLSNYHHTGVGHAMSWFQGRGGWSRGPAYATPIYTNIYPGYAWSAIPTDAVLCWYYDPATGQYYEAYYYPQYGYYAWYDNPTVAVGIYNPSFAIVIR